MPKCRRKALRALRERGGPEPLALLGRLVNDEELDIREDAIDLVMRIYIEPPPKHKVGAPRKASFLRRIGRRRGRHLLTWCAR